MGLYNLAHSAAKRFASQASESLLVTGVHSLYDEIKLKQWFNNRNVAQKWLLSIWVYYICYQPSSRTQNPTFPTLVSHLLRQTIQLSLEIPMLTDRISIRIQEVLRPLCHLQRILQSMVTNTSSGDNTIRVNYISSLTD